MNASLCLGLVRATLDQTRKLPVKKTSAILVNARVAARKHCPIFLCNGGVQGGVGKSNLIAGGLSEMRLVI
jgi:hypothetical protein